MKNYSILLIMLIVIFKASVISAQVEASASSIELRSGTENLSDRNARFPDLAEYLSQHLVYPELAQENSLEGTVKVEVLINEFGKVSEVCILQGLGKLIDAPVMELLREMPRWMPAVRNGQKVPQRLVVPVKFSLH